MKDSFWGGIRKLELALELELELNCDGMMLVRVSGGKEGVLKEGGV